MKYWYVCVSCSVISNSLWPIDCSLADFSVHGILQARILVWIAISFSRGSFWPRVQTRVSRIEGRFFTIWATREAPKYWRTQQQTLKSNILRERSQIKYNVLYDSIYMRFYKKQNYSDRKQISDLLRLAVWGRDWPQRAIKELSIVGNRNVPYDDCSGSHRRLYMWVSTVKTGEFYLNSLIKNCTLLKLIKTVYKENFCDFIISWGIETSEQISIWAVRQLLSPSFLWVTRACQ